MTLFEKKLRKDANAFLDCHSLHLLQLDPDEHPIFMHTASVADWFMLTNKAVLIFDDLSEKRVLWDNICTFSQSKPAHSVQSLEICLSDHQENVFRIKTSSKSCFQAIWNSLLRISDRNEFIRTNAIKFFQRTAFISELNKLVAQESTEGVFSFELKSGQLIIEYESISCKSDGDSWQILWSNLQNIQSVAGDGGSMLVIADTTGRDRTVKFINYSGASQAEQLLTLIVRRKRFIDEATRVSRSLIPDL